MLLAVDYLSLLPRAVAAFALGAVPFAWLIVKLAKGIDVRTLGSGNVGATNASRAFASKGGRIGVFLLVYVLDAGKGLLAALLGGVGSGALFSASPEAVICAAFAILGHVFTPFLGGRGGKGVATASGALAAQPKVLSKACAFGCNAKLGNCYVASSSSSLDFPLLNESQTTIGGLQDAVAFKLNSNLSTYLALKLYHITIS